MRAGRLTYVSVRQLLEQRVEAAVHDGSVADRHRRRVPDVLVHRVDNRRRRRGVFTQPTCTSVVAASSPSPPVRRTPTPSLPVAQLRGPEGQKL